MSSFNISARRFKHLVILFVLGTLLTSGCSMDNTDSFPSDFSFLMDARSADKETALNINVRINAKGNAEYDLYETGGAIRYDLNDIVMYDANQVVSSGTFKLSKAELTQLWDAINTNRFFDLEDAYQMALGHSYAFIMIEANGKKHKVDNIGVELPEVRALVEAVSAFMPEGMELEYGEGYIFEE